MRATFSLDGIRDKTACMSSPQNHTLRAGLYMVITTACFVAGDTCIKLIGTSLPLGQVICLIGVVSSLFLLIVCGQQGILKNVPMIFTRMVLLRSLFDTMGSFMFVSALMHMPLANLSSVMQSVPLVVVAVGVIFLGEKAGLSRIAAVIAGFVGVLLIVKPQCRKSLPFTNFLRLARSSSWPSAISSPNAFRRMFRFSS